MGLFLGYLLGFAVALGLIVGFAKYQNLRSKKRIDLMQKLCLLYIITFFSSLSCFPSHEIVTPPRVAILESEPNEIVIELDMQWDGNPDIVLDIKTRVGVALPIQAGKVKDVWLKLVKDLDIQRDNNKNRGQVHLELIYCPFSTENVWTHLIPNFCREGTQTFDSREAAAANKKDIIVRGVLSVTVVSAESVPATDLMVKSGPFVVLTMKKSEHRNKTRVPFS
ncbi:synaptotagmin-4-like [Salvia splendens]|uniref:synaptotagmin-4-like n=1 Tax=Salvia splendens TaxID=180675 RepID=UPI001C25A7C7|nr:synaptotagmin-4-like [Salvia splendens]